MDPLKLFQQKFYEKLKADGVPTNPAQRTDDQQGTVILDLALTRLEFAALQSVTLEGVDNA